MKKILLTFMLALMAVVIHAATFTQGDFIYEIVNDTTCNLQGLSSAGTGKTYLKITGYTFNASTQKYCKVQTIKADAFENNQTITEVRIGPGVETIENYAFYNCNKLAIVSLPSTIKSLGNSVFYNCPITLINCAAETMPTFTTYTFNGLGTISGTRSWWEGTKAGLDAARANSTITSLFSVAKNEPTAYDIATNMGSSSPNYRCTVYAIVTKAWSPVRQRGGECKIIYATPNSQNTTATLEVPYNTDLTDTNWDRYEPTEIADYAFQGTQSIKVLDLTNAPTSTFKRIGVCAFENCKSLTKVILSAQRVDHFAFNGCTNLSTVRLYGSNENNYCVQQLGKDCFKGTAVTSVYIPKGLTLYEGGPFNSCPNLTQFTVSSESSTFAAYNYSLYSKDYTTLYQYPSGRNAFYFFEQCHASMTKINGYAFKGNTVTSWLVIPYGVTRIGAEAFSGMTKLETLKIPSSASTFDWNAFQYMTALKNFYFNRKTIPSALTSSTAFYNIKSGCVLHVPRQSRGTYSSTSPWSTAFTGGIVEGCYDHLVTINNGSALDYYMGYTVTSAATYSDPVAQSGTFNGQMSLTYCETAVEGGFQGTINIPVTMSLRGKTYMVTEVDREVCRNDPRITSITGGAAVKKIGALAFAGLTASNYGSCYIPNPVEFGDSCFSGSTFSTIKLGTRLERIGQEALRGTYIGQLIMPNTVNYIGSRFVAGATKLDTIKISNSITNIPFQGLAGVNARYIVLPYGVKTIGAYAFVSDQFRVDNGAAIPEIGGSNYVVIPSSVTTIDSDAFSCARHLEGIYLNCPYGVFTSVKNNWRRRMDLNASNAYDWSGHKLYVPVGQVQQYRNDPGIAAAWNENNDVGPGAFDFTYDNNFVGTSYRMTVVNSTLKSAKYVYCKGNSTNVILLSNTETDHNTGVKYTMVEIGDSAFVKHTAATHIYLDDATSLTRIGAHAFRGLTLLNQEVNVPESVSQIGSYAFYGCTKLPSVFLNRSSSTTSIGTYMFSTTQTSILYVPLNRMYSIAQQCPWLANTAANRRLLPYVKPTTEWSAISVPVSDNILLPSTGTFYYASSFNSGNYSLGKTQLSNSQGIKGGEGMLMKGTVGTVYRFRRNDAVSSYSYVSPSTNYLKGVTNAYSQTLTYSSSGPYYYTFDGTDMFNRVNSSATVYSGGAYVQTTSSYSNIYINSDITTYNLWINGTQVTSENCSNLKVINGVSGTTVSYSPTTNTLTLSGATITTADAVPINCKISGLTIKVIGTNNVTATTNNHIALQIMQNTTITGTGTLNAGSAVTSGCLVNTGKTLTVNGGVKVKFIGKIYGIYGYSSTSRLIISGANTKLTANGITGGSYYQLPTTMNDGLAITSPAGAYFNNGTVIYGSSVAKNIEVVISKPTFTRGDVDGDGSVSISDVTVLIDYLLSGNASGVNLSGADTDQDGSVSISDVTVLIDYLLAGSW